MKKIRFLTATRGPIDFWQLEVISYDDSYGTIVFGPMGVMINPNDTYKYKYRLTSPYKVKDEDLFHNTLADAKYACINHFFQMANNALKYRRGLSIMIDNL